MKYVDQEGLNLYDELIKHYIDVKSRVVSTDNTILVNDKDLTANIDNNTIVKDANGIMSVSSTALTQYLGDKAIKITPQQNGNKIVSIELDTENQVLNNTNSGLNAIIKLQAVSNSELQTLGNNIREAYKLTGINNTSIANSDIIKIYKDSSLLGVKLLHSREVDTYKSIVEVIENIPDESFIGQQFYVKTLELTGSPLELFTLDGNSTGISVNAELFSEEVQAEDAILYTREEIDAHNATLDIWQYGKTYLVTKEYSAEEAAQYNSKLEGAISTEDIKTPAVPATYYTVQEAIDYNATLPGAVTEGDPKEYYTTQEAIDYNSQLDGAVTTDDIKVPASPEDPDSEEYYTEEEAIEYNSQLPGAISEGDIKSTYTSAEAIEYNAQLSGAIAEGDVKTAEIPAIYYTEQEVIQANSQLPGAVTQGDEYTDEVEYTEEEIDEHNTTLDIWQSGKIKVPAIEYQPAVYSFTSFSTSNGTQYGTGKVALLSQETIVVTIKPTYSRTTGWIDIQNPKEEEIALCFAYEDSDYNVIVEAIPIANFLRESEFKDGFEINQNGEIFVKIDPTSEGYISISSNGIKLYGIAAALIANKTTLTEVSADSEIPSTGAPKIIVTKETQLDGHDNYDITGQDLASALKLSTEETRAKNAESNIDNVIGLTKGINDETRTYINTGNYIGKEVNNTIKSDIKAIDTKLKEIADNTSEFVAATYGSTSGVIDPTKEIDRLFIN